MFSAYDISINTFAERNYVDDASIDEQGKESSEVFDAVLMAAHILSNVPDPATQETPERGTTTTMTCTTPRVLCTSSSPTALVPELSNSTASSDKHRCDDAINNNNTARPAKELISSSASLVESSDMPIETFVYNYTLAHSTPSVEASRTSSSSQLLPVSTPTASQEMYSYIAQPLPPQQTRRASIAPSSSSTESGSDVGEPSCTVAYNVCDRSLFPADSADEVVPADTVDADTSMVLNQDEAFLRSGTPSRAHSAGNEQMMFGSRPASLLESFYLNRAASWNSPSSSTITSLSSRSEMRLSGYNTGRPNFFVERARQLAMRQNSTMSSNLAGTPGTVLPTSPPPMTAQQQQHHEQEPMATRTTTVTRTTSSVASSSTRNLLGGYWLWRGKSGLYPSDVSDRGWTDSGSARMPTTANPANSPPTAITGNGGAGGKLDITRAAGAARPVSAHGNGVTRNASNLSRLAPPTSPSLSPALPLISSTEERIRSPSGKHFMTSVTTTTTTTTLHHNDDDAMPKPRYINGVRIFRGSFDNDASLDSSPFITHGNGSMRAEHGLGRRLSQVGFVREESSSSSSLPIGARAMPSSFSVPANGAVVASGGTPVANAAATWRLLSFKKQDDGPIKSSSGARRKKKKGSSKGSKDKKSREKRPHKNNNRHVKQDEAEANSPVERPVQRRQESPVEVNEAGEQANGDRATAQTPPPLVPQPPSRQSDEPRARTSPGNNVAAAVHLPRNDAASRHAMTQPCTSDGVPRRRNAVRHTPFLLRLLNMNNDTRSVNGGEPPHSERIGHNRNDLRASFDGRQLPSLT